MTTVSKSFSTQTELAKLDLNDERKVQMMSLTHGTWEHMLVTIMRES